MTSFEAGNTDFDFSRIHAVNPDTICVTTQQICPAKAHYAALYEERASTVEAEHLPAFAENKRSNAILAIKLGEIDIAAVGFGCSGAIEATCPVREKMDNSTVRTTAVKGLRRFLGSKKTEEK